MLPSRPIAGHTARLMRSRPLRAAFGGCRKRQALSAPLCAALSEIVGTRRQVPSLLAVSTACGASNKVQGVQFQAP